MKNYGALPEGVRRRLRPEMNRQLYELDRASLEVIRLDDGHFIYFDIEGKECGIRQIQPWGKEQLLAIAVIIASPRTILQRRLKDARVRYDRKCDIDFLIKEQKMEVAIAISQAAELGVLLYFVSNEGGESPTASEILLFFCVHQALCRKILRTLP